MGIRTYRVQTCDGCSDSRDLTEKQSPETNGWREVQPGKHLCPNCIHAALKKD